MVTKVSQSSRLYKVALYNAIFLLQRLHVYLHRRRAITNLYRHVNRRFKSSRMVGDLISLHKGSAKLSLLRERITRIVNMK